MLKLDPVTVRQWVLAQPGGHTALGSGLGDDVMPDVGMALEDLAEVLETSMAFDPAALSASLRSEAGLAAFHALAPHLSAGRRLRLVSWLIETNVPDCAAVLKGLLDPSGPGAVLLADVRRLHQAALLDLVFSPQRLARVQAACQPGQR